MRPGRVLLAPALLLAAAASATAAEPILPLADVRPGMVGEARTVVQGTAITSFPVTVLDVQRTADAPGGALILIRAEGPLMALTGGLAEGMSGSPVTVTGADGVRRVIGAIAFGTGDAENVIGGVTPIEQMLRPSRGRLADERPPARPLTRWMVSGASRALLAQLVADLGRRGVRLTSTGGRQPRPSQPLVPGASLAALLVAGDITVGGVGTVTYVDGDRVLGFGHPFTDVGRSRYLMGDAYVYQTIPSPLDGSSYKLAEAGTLHGAIVGDRADGVVGRNGPARAIRLVSRARDLRRGTRSTVRAQVAADPAVLPQVGDLLQGEAMVRATDGLAGGTLRLRIRITSPALRRPVVYRNLYAAQSDVVGLSLGPLARLGAALLGNGVREIPIGEIRVDQVLEPRVRAARVVAARVRPARVRPGARATLVLLLQPWRGARRTVRVPIRIPADIEPGRRRLIVLPNAPAGFDSAPPDLADALGAGTSAGRARALVRGLDAEAARLPGPRLRRLLEALERATADRHDAVRVLAPGEDPEDPRAGVPAPAPLVIYGGRAVPRITVLAPRAEGSGRR